MRLLSLLPVSLLVACALGQDDTLPPPGEPALTYTDGSFLEPNGGTSSYGEGNMMNISWTTTYETTNIYLIAGYVWANPIQLTTNTAQNWFQWKVTTDSTNSSEIYVFRAVNGTGTADQKAVGGFLSAAFYIPVKEKQKPSTTLSTLSTSASEPTKTAIGDGAVGNDSNPTGTPTSTPEPESGLSKGTKISVGVGVGVGVTGLLALAAAFIFWRKSKGKNKNPGPQPHEMPLNQDFSPHFQSPQPYNPNMQEGAGYYKPPLAGQGHDAVPYNNTQHELAGYYKPPGAENTHGAELDAGQGHSFIQEANDQRTPRAELQ
ncbi:hypothetical protein F4808DRAFT_49623 [Astrocystis sublimbata]|nr:hypothetical protein F4808DRAFT_49623 [Astrocystis sublimbata]